MALRQRRRPTRGLCLVPAGVKQSGRTSATDTHGLIPVERSRNGPERRLRRASFKRPPCNCLGLLPAARSCYPPARVQPQLAFPMSPATNPAILACALLIEAVGYPAALLAAMGHPVMVRRGAGMVRSQFNRDADSSWLRRIMGGLRCWRWRLPLCRRCYPGGWSGAAAARACRRRRCSPHTVRAAYLWTHVHAAADALSGLKAAQAFAHCRPQSAKPR